jgi:hypothetical protein
MRGLIDHRTQNLQGYPGHFVGPYALQGMRRMDAGGVIDPVWSGLGMPGAGGPLGSPWSAGSGYPGSSPTGGSSPMGTASPVVPLGLAPPSIGSGASQNNVPIQGPGNTGLAQFGQSVAGNPGYQLGQAYNSAYQNALAQNSQMYGSIMSGYGNLGAAQGAAQGNITQGYGNLYGQTGSAYGQLQGAQMGNQNAINQGYTQAGYQQVGAQQGINQGYNQLGAQQNAAGSQILGGYGGLENQVMSTIQGVGQSQAQQIADITAQNQGQAQQGMISSGLGNTTAEQSVQSGIMLQGQKADVALSNQLAQLGAGYESSIGGAQLNYANQLNTQNTALGAQQLGFQNQAYQQNTALQGQQLNYQNLANQQDVALGSQDIQSQNQVANASLNYQNQANTQNTALGQNQLNFMNSVTAQYPNANNYENLMAQMGALQQSGVSGNTGYPQGYVPGSGFSPGPGNMGQSPQGYIPGAGWNPGPGNYGYAAGGEIGERVLSTSDSHKGGEVNKPTVLVGEGGPHPEFVIPTDPQHRARAVKLFAELGSKLGIQGMDSGGVVSPFMAGTSGLGGQLYQNSQLGQQDISAAEAPQASTDSVLSGQQSMPSSSGYGTPLPALGSAVAIPGAINGEALPATNYLGGMAGAPLPAETNSSQAVQAPDPTSINIFRGGNGGSSGGGYGGSGGYQGNPIVTSSGGGYSPVGGAPTGSGGYSPVGGNPPMRGGAPTPSNPTGGYSPIAPGGYSPIGQPIATGGGYGPSPTGGGYSPVGGAPTGSGYTAPRGGGGSPTTPTPTPTAPTSSGTVSGNPVVSGGGYYPYGGGGGYYPYGGGGGGGAGGGHGGNEQHNPVVGSSSGGDNGGDSGEGGLDEGGGGYTPVAPGTPIFGPGVAGGAQSNASTGPIIGGPVTPGSPGSPVTYIASDPRGTRAGGNTGRMTPGVQAYAQGGIVQAGFRKGGSPIWLQENIAAYARGGIIRRLAEGGEVKPEKISDKEAARRYREAVAMAQAQQERQATYQRSGITPSQGQPMMSNAHGAQRPYVPGYAAGGIVGANVYAQNNGLMSPGSMVGADVYARENGRYGNPGNTVGAAMYQQENGRYPRFR